MTFGWTVIWFDGDVFCSRIEKFEMISSRSSTPNHQDYFNCWSSQDTVILDTNLFRVLHRVASATPVLGQSAFCTQASLQAYIAIYSHIFVPTVQELFIRNTARISCPSFSPLVHSFPLRLSDYRLMACLLNRISNQSSRASLSLWFNKSLVIIWISAFGLPGWQHARWAIAQIRWLGLLFSNSFKKILTAMVLLSNAWCIGHKQ